MKTPPRRVLVPGPVARTAAQVRVRVEGWPGDRVELFVSSEHQPVVARPPEVGVRIVGQPLVPPIQLGRLVGEGASFTHELPLAALSLVSRASCFYLQARFQDPGGAVVWGSGCALRLLEDGPAPSSSTDLRGA